MDGIYFHNNGTSHCEAAEAAAANNIKKNPSGSQWDRKHRSHHNVVFVIHIWSAIFFGM